MKTEFALMIYDEAAKAIAANGEFIEKVTRYHGIDQGTYNMYSWNLEPTEEGGVAVVGSFEDLDEDQPADFSAGIPFDALWNEVTGDFADMVRGSCKTWFLMSATRECVRVDASDGTVSWNSRFPSPDVDGAFEERRGEIEAILQEAGSPDKALGLARWLWEESEIGDYDIRLSEQESRSSGE